MPPLPHLPSGASAGDYRIESLIAGGFDTAHAFVYRAIGPDGGSVALKECAPSACALRDGTVIRARAGLDAELAEAQRRFGAEAAALSRIASPRLPKVLAAFEANGTVYCAMEDIPGPNLAERLAEGPVPEEQELLRLIREIGEGLTALHAAGWLHRDVKPANILLDPARGAILADLGAAAPIGAPTEAGGASFLTPGFAAPEQYVDNGNEGPWTDIYGLAALAYRAIAGSTPPAAAERLRHDAMTPAEILGRGRYSMTLLTAIDQGLALAPDRRPSTVESWLKELPMTDPADPTGPQTSSSGMAADIPPTVPVERRPVPPPAIRLGGLTRPEADPKKGGMGRWGLRIGSPLLILAVLAALALFGPDYYRRNIKSEWLVDAGGTGDTATIMEALRTAKADAIVRVMPGTYPESLALVRPVSLIGVPEAPETVIVAPESGVCLASAVEHGLITGLAFEAAAAPGAALGLPCIVTSAGALRLDRVQARGADGPALLVTGEAAPDVTMSALYGGAGSALTVDRAGGTFQGNEIRGGAKPAVILRAQADPLLRENRIAGGDSAGILATTGARGRIEANGISTPLGSGIEVRDGADPQVSGNRIEGAGEAGIFVHQDGHGTFSDNTVMASGYSGIVLGRGGEPAMTGNTVQGNGEHGALLLDGAGGRLDGNTFRDNAGHGIAVVTGALTELIANDVEGNREPQILEGGLATAQDEE